MVTRLTVLLAIFLSVTVQAEVEKAEQKPVFNKGAKCLFIGHSFFVPVAKAFDAIARENDFPSHKADFVFAGGKFGSPGLLWDNPFHGMNAKKKLATGKVDLFGMTCFDETNSSLKHYVPWIDLALKHNPKTRIFIGLCWTPFGPRLTSQKYDQNIQANCDRLSRVIKDLREKYQDTHFYYMNYGKVAYEMKLRHDDGNLPGIKTMVGKDSQSLFRDKFGHAGPMLLSTSAMVWLKHLYNADIEKLKGEAVKKSPVAIASKVAAYNQQFR